MNINFQNIAPTDLRDYAKSLGWELLPEAVADGLYVLFHPKFEKRQLVFPVNSDAPDYIDSIESSLNKLADLTKQPISIVISGLSELKDDTLRFRLVDKRKEENYIPLSYAVTAINGAKEMFLSAACSVLKPQSHHPRLSRIEAWQLIEASRFHHTESGSFVLNVSSPVQAIEIQGNMFDSAVPFVRQTFLTINKGISKLVTAIQADTLTSLVDEIKSADSPEISSNLCKAITNFKEEHNDYDLFLNFNWAGTIPNILPVKNVIKIQNDYFSRIDDVRRELKNSEQKNSNDEVFMATVENLAGEIGNDGRRSGEVILNLYQGNDEIIRAKTSLDSTLYFEADKAHMTQGAYIRVKGKLNPGNQPRNLSEVSLFELILP